MRARFANRVLVILLSVSASFFSGCGGGDGNGGGGGGGTGQPVDSATKVYGRVLSAADDKPLSGATIAVAGVTGQVKTDSQGRFVFPVPKAGTYAVTATLSGYTYAQRQVKPAEGELASVADMYLTPEDSKAITLGSIGGSGSNSDGSIELQVPVGALNKTTSMRATWYKRGKDLPNYLPTQSHFTYACELTPDGQTFAQPIIVRMKNSRGFAAGTKIPVGVYDKNTLTWKHESMATVSSDGKWVEYTVSHFSPRDVNLARTSPAGSGEPGSAMDISAGTGAKVTSKTNHPCSTVGGGSQIGVADGHLSVDYVLPAYRSLNQVRAVALQYNSQTANAAPVLGVTYDISKTSVPLPTRIRFVVEVGGQRIERFFKPITGAMNFRYRWDGKDGMGKTLSAGSYSYKLTLTNEYQAVFATASVFGGAAVATTGITANEYVGFPSTFSGKVSLSQPVGASANGWSVVGQYQLKQSGSTVSIRAGDGSGFVFTANSGGTYAGAAGDFSQLTKATDGTFIWTGTDLSKTVFNANGRQTSVSDRNGNKTLFAYDSNGYMSSITDPLGKVTTFAYDASGNLSSITDPFNRSTQFQSDTAGNIVKITNPDGTSRQFAYDSQHRMTSQTDAAGRKTTYTFDTTGAVIRVDRADSTYTQYNTGSAMGMINDLAAGTGTESNPASLGSNTPASFTDGAGGTYTFAVNAYKTRTSVTDPLGRTLLMQRDSNDQVTSLKMPSGSTTTYTYDARGNVAQLVSERTVDFTYDGTLNLPLTIKDDAVGSWQFTYDSNGNVTQSKLPSGKTTTFAYNQQGQLVSNTVDSRTRSYSYNSDGNLASVTDPAGGKWTFAYDTYGNLSSVTDPDNRTRTAKYNSMNLPTEITNGAGETAKFTYAPAKGSADLRGDGPIAVITEIADGNGKKTTFGFDAMYRLASLTDAMGNKTTFAYDKAGRMISRTEPTGAKVSLTYNSAGQLTQKSHGSGGQTVSYTYDKTTGMLTAAGTTQGKVDISYDTYDRISKATTTFLPSNFRVDLAHSYRAYNSFESLTTLTVGSDSMPFGFDYDVPGGELARSVIGAGFFWQYLSYDAAKRMTGWQESYSGTTSQFTYDAADRLTGETYKNSLSTTMFASSRKYSAGGLVSQMTDADGVHSYSYDNAGRLVKATHPTADNPAENYSYDAAGNRRIVGQETSFVYDAANRLTADNVYQYTYDASGNLTQKIHKASSAVTQYGYDAENRLTSVVLPGGPTVTFVYGPFGRRIEKRVGPVITRYVYDGDEEIAEFDGSNNLIRSYVNGEQLDVPAGLKVGSFSSYTNYYYYTDPVGTVLAVAQADGTVAVSYRYQAFGLPVAGTGPPTNPRLFAGRTYDSQSGLYYLRNRFYDPSSGRFLQRDPIPRQAAIAPYAYADSDPVNGRDPFGLAPVGSEISAVAGLVSDTAVKPAINDMIGKGMEAVADVAPDVAESATSKVGRAAAHTLRLGSKAATAWGIYNQTKDIIDIATAKCPTRAAIKWYKSQWWNPAGKYTDSFLTIGGLASRPRATAQSPRARKPYVPRTVGLRR